MPSQAALLIGDIVHARAEWEALSSLVTLKVQTRGSIAMKTKSTLMVELDRNSPKADGKSF